MSPAKKYTIFGVVAILLFFIFSFDNEDISKIKPAILAKCPKTELYVVHRNSEATHEIYDCTGVNKKELK